MKLCRFELVVEPGTVRSGIVHSGKIYETDGANPIAVHEAADVRPLSPIGAPPSLRFFRNPEMRGETLGDDEAETLAYQYSNPNCLVPASTILDVPGYAHDLACEPYVAVVIAQPARMLASIEADDVALGFTILNRLVDRRLSEVARGGDFGCAIGPVLSTPDDLDERVVDLEFGKRYQFEVVMRVNGVERRRGDVNGLPITFAQAVAACSLGAPLAAGDVIALGPLASWTRDDPPLEQGDEVQVAVDGLGALSIKIGGEAERPARRLAEEAG